MGLGWDVEEEEEEGVKNGEIWNEVVGEGEGGGKCNTRNAVREVGVNVMTCREEG